MPGRTRRRRELERICTASSRSAAGTAVIESDLTDPGAMLADSALRAVIDVGKPVCVVLGLVHG